MAQNILIGCLPDWLQQSGATVTAESEVASLPDDNLLDTSISKVWRSSGALTDKGGIAFDLGETRAWDSLALVNHNLVEGDYFRVVYGSAALTSATEQIDVDAVASSGVTLTGGVTNVDEDVDSPNYGDVINMTNGPDGWIRFSFASPSANLKTGGNYQAFRIRWTANSAGDMAGNIRLSESGTVKATLGYVDWQDPPSSTGGSIYVDDTGPNTYCGIWFWDAASLASAAGANVEVDFSIADAGDVDIYAVDWIAAIDISGSTFGDWIEVTGLPSSWGGADLSTLGARDAIQTLSHIFTTAGVPATISARYGRVDFLSPTNSYVEAGRLAVGRSFYGQQLVDNFDVGVMDPTEYRRSKGGQLWRRVRQAYRVATLPLFGDQSDILRDVYQTLYRSLGSTGDFLLAIFPDSTTDAPILSWWATLRPESRSIRGETGIMTDGDDAIWSTTLEVEEVL